MVPGHPGQTEQSAASWAGIDPYELLTAEAGQAPAGSEGLLFLPYLTGERIRIRPSRKGGWIGLTARHSRAHLVRAVLEGVGFALRDALGDGGSLVPGDRRGPGLWRRGSQPHVAPNSGRYPGPGIADCAGDGRCRARRRYPGRSGLRHLSFSAGGLPGAHPCSLLHGSRECRNVVCYAEFYAIYRELYGALQSTNHRLSDLAI